MLHVIALGRYAAAYTRSWAVNGRIARGRLKAENDGLRQQVAVLTEEIRISAATATLSRSGVRRDRTIMRSQHISQPPDALRTARRE
jgi:hypothetical protein